MSGLKCYLVQILCQLHCLEMQALALSRISTATRDSWVLSAANTEVLWNEHKLPSFLLITKSRWFNQIKRRNWWVRREQMNSATSMKHTHEKTTIHNASQLTFFLLSKWFPEIPLQDTNVSLPSNLHYFYCREIQRYYPVLFLSFLDEYSEQYELALTPSSSLLSNFCTVRNSRHILYFYLRNSRHILYFHLLTQSHVKLLDQIFFPLSSKYFHIQEEIHFSNNRLENPFLQLSKTSH